MRESKARSNGDASPATLRLLLRLPAVVMMTGLARSTIYRLIAQDKFPPPVQLSSRAIAWRRDDVEQWSSTRPPVSH